MPLSFECELKGADEFLTSSASTLYWKPVPVLLRYVEREDQQEELTIRILSGVAKQNHSLRILRIHISNEQDLCFLHTLEVTEEDFQRLKAEQGILVDFANFPAKIVGLLERCITSSPADAPRFQAVLTVRGADSTFSIVETNDFKQLPHISLCFCPGNDNTIKQFLAFRLSEVRADYERVSSELSTAQKHNKTLDESLSDTKSKFVKLKEEHDQHVLEAQAEIKSQLVQAQQEKSIESEQLKSKLQREREEAEAKLREQLEQLTVRVAELDAENRKLRDSKYELDCKVSELSHKVGSAEGTCSSLEEEKNQLKADNNRLHSELHQKDIQLNEAQAKLAAAQEKLRASADLSDHQKLRLADLENSCKQWEERWKEVRESAASHEQRAREASAEVVKGNQIIEKLTTELRVSREKARRKAAIMSRQEEELQQRQSELANEQCKTATMQSTVDKLQAQVSQLQSEKERLSNTIQDNQQQLEQNENMIRWLNQQLTETQLHTAAGAASSRFSMKPVPGLSSTMPSLSSTLPASLSCPLPSALSSTHATTTSTYTPTNPTSYSQSNPSSYNPPNASAYSSTNPSTYTSTNPSSYMPGALPTGHTNLSLSLNSPSKIPATMSIASNRKYTANGLPGTTLPFTMKTDPTSFPSKLQPSSTLRVSTTSTA